MTLPALKTPNIGDELSAAGVDWAWYSGGWSNASGVIGGPGWTNGHGPTCSDPNTVTTATYDFSVKKGQRTSTEAMGRAGGFHARGIGTSPQRLRGLPRMARGG